MSYPTRKPFLTVLLALSVLFSSAPYQGVLGMEPELNPFGEQAEFVSVESALPDLIVEPLAPLVPDIAVEPVAQDLVITAEPATPDLFVEPVAESFLNPSVPSAVVSTADPDLVVDPINPPFSAETFADPAAPDIVVDPVIADLVVEPANLPSLADTFTDPAEPDLAVNPMIPDLVVEPMVPDLVVEPAAADLIIEPEVQQSSQPPDQPPLSSTPPPVEDDEEDSANGDDTANNGGTGGNDGGEPSDDDTNGAPPESNNGSSGGGGGGGGGSGGGSGGGGGGGISTPPQQPQIGMFTIKKFARNKTNGETAWLKTIQADPLDVVEFRVVVSATGPVSTTKLVVREVLPRLLPYRGGLSVNGVQNQQNIAVGMELPALETGKTYDIVFEAQVASAANFPIGASDLINVILVYSTQKALTDVAGVRVQRSALTPGITPPSQQVPLGLEVSASYTPNGILITARVQQDLSGPITFRIDCNTAEGSGWDTLSTGNSTEFSALCLYPQLITYTAKVQAEREGVIEEKTLNVDVLALTPSAFAEETSPWNLFAGLGIIDIFGNPLFVLFLALLIVLILFIMYTRRRLISLREMSRRETVVSNGAFPPSL